MIEDISGLMFIHLVPLILTGGFLFFFNKNFFKLKQFNWTEWKEMAIYGYPVVLYSLLQWANQYFDRLILNTYGYSKIVSDNFILMTFFSILNVLFYALIQAIGPDIYFKLNDIDSKVLFKKYLNKILPICILGVCLSSLLFVPIFSLVNKFIFNSKFIIEFPILIYYNLGFGISVVASIFLLLYNYYGFNKYVPIYFLMAVIIQYLLFFVLVQFNPAYATSVAFLAAQLIFTVLLYINLFSRLNKTL